MRCSFQIEFFKCHPNFFTWTYCYIPMTEKIIIRPCFHSVIFHVEFDDAIAFPYRIPTGYYYEKNKQTNKRVLRLFHKGGSYKKKKNVFTFLNGCRKQSSFIITGTKNDFHKISSRHGFISFVSLTKSFFFFPIPFVCFGKYTQMRI